MPDKASPPLFFLSRIFFLAIFAFKKCISSIESAYQVPQRTLLLLLLEQGGIFGGPRSTVASVGRFIQEHGMPSASARLFPVPPFLSHKNVFKIFVQLSFIVNFIPGYFNFFVTVTNVVVSSFLTPKSG